MLEIIFTCPVEDSSLLKARWVTLGHIYRMTLDFDMVEVDAVDFMPHLVAEEEPSGNRFKEIEDAVRILKENPISSQDYLTLFPEKHLLYLLFNVPKDLWHSSALRQELEKNLLASLVEGYFTGTTAHGHPPLNKFPEVRKCLLAYLDAEIPDSTESKEAHETRFLDFADKLSLKSHLAICSSNVVSHPYKIGSELHKVWLRLVKEPQTEYLRKYTALLSKVLRHERDEIRYSLLDLEEEELYRRVARLLRLHFKDLDQFAQAVPEDLDAFMTAHWRLVCQLYFLNPYSVAKIDFDFVEHTEYLLAFLKTHAWDLPFALRLAKIKPELDDARQGLGKKAPLEVMKEALGEESKML